MTIALIVISCLLLLAILVVLIFILINQKDEDKLPYLLLTEDPSKSIYIAWHTVRRSGGTVRYGTSKDCANSASDKRIARQHVVKLTGLKPGTEYFYRIEFTRGSPDSTVKDDFSRLYSFRTAEQGEKNFSFSLFGDPQRPGPNEGVVKLVKEFNSNFSVCLGDIAASGWLNTDWNTFFTRFRDIFCTKPFAATIGNHDCLLFGYVRFKYYIPMPAGPGPYSVYSFDYQGVHFVSMNIRWGGRDFTRAQRTFLEKDLAAAQGKYRWIIVFLHSTVFSSGDFGTNVRLLKTLKPVLEKYKVDFVLSGHDHHYERVEQDGITYIVEGAAGWLDPEEDSVIPGSKIYNVCFSAVKFTFENGNLKMLAKNTDGAVIDEIHLSKETANAPVIKTYEMPNPSPKPVIDRLKIKGRMF
ncbi:MAG: metallophosphoesterase family protein [bacterium]